MRRIFRAAALDRGCPHLLHRRRRCRPFDRLAGRTLPRPLLCRPCRHAPDGRIARPQRPSRSRPGRRSRRPGAGRDPRHRAGRCRRASSTTAEPARARPAARSPSWSPTMRGTETPDDETDCLARAVYWESKGEPLAGQLAVAEVIINRAAIGPLRADHLRRRPPARPILLRPPRPYPAAAVGSRDWRIAVAIAQIAHAGPRRRRRAARACSSTPAGSVRAGA